MIWCGIITRQTILKCAAYFAAHFICIASVAAQDVTFRSADNAIEVSGRFVAFDGQLLTVEADNGLVSFRADGLTCDGAACPDLNNFTPQFRLIGAQKMADRLMPALIDVYVRDKGWRLNEDVDGFEIRRSDGTPVLRILVDVESADVAFEEFVNHNADALLSMRELRRTEIDEAFRAGLGRLSLARQGRILALDALVPITSPSSDLTSLSLGDLSQALAGLGSFDVHLPVDSDGQLQGFEDRFMRPFGLEMVEPSTRHDGMRELLDAVESTRSSLSLVPFGQARNSQQLKLSGPCSLESEARFLTMKTEDYPLTFPMFLYLPQRTLHPAVTEFLDWLRSPSAQLVIRRSGFVDLAAVPIALSDQGDRLANAITNAGEEISLAELQRMIRILSPRVRMSSTFRFEPGSTRLDGQSRSNVMQLAQAIRNGRFGNRELMFVGFSDGRGPALANRDLSAARAEAVRRDVERALAGVIPSNTSIETEAFGEALPMACDDTIWGQQTNRRVELWVRELD